ncbi:unnamed protein product [Strongylus vulgaris]|uniref:Uncharacterized protein n=1 Tax=Strongylus vulgaris TaxID=40348 RepID=A0A3P7M153_STRVU|nr:unnamed protein product [Strongylus vulgaris]
MGGALGLRVKVHMANERRGNLALPLGRNKFEAHEGNDFEVKCVILAYDVLV